MITGTESCAATNHNGFRGQTTSDLLWPPCTEVRNTTKDRLVIGGLMLVALPIVISSLPWAHRAFEAWLDLRRWAHVTIESLNLLWLFVALAAFFQWVSPRIKSYRNRLPLSGLVSLIFALALLFPVISANDDVAELELINDAVTSRSLATVFKSDKQLHTVAGLPDALPGTLSQFTFSVSLDSEFVAEPAFTLSVAIPGETTGNHSPPLC